MSKQSNRMKALRQARDRLSHKQMQEAKQTKIGTAEAIRRHNHGRTGLPRGASIQAVRVGIARTGSGKSRSRIPKAWSDTHRKQDVRTNGVSKEWWKASISVPTPIIHTVGATRTFKGISWRDGPDLFDACASMEARISDMRPRHLLIGDVVTNRSKEKRIAYHTLVGDLPPWTPSPVPVKRAKLEADQAVAVWRQAQQLAHHEQLMRWANH